MNHYSNDVAGLASKVNGYNFDDLLEVLTSWNTPKEVRRALLTIYFHAAQSVFNNGESAGDDLAWAFITLQEVIEALDTVNDTKAAKLAVIAK